MRKASLYLAFGAGFCGGVIISAVIRKPVPDPIVAEDLSREQLEFRWRWDDIIKSMDALIKTACDEQGGSDELRNSLVKTVILARLFRESLSHDQEFAQKAVKSFDGFVRRFENYPDIAGGDPSVTLQHSVDMLIAGVVSRQPRRAETPSTTD